MMFGTRANNFLDSVKLADAQFCVLGQLKDVGPGLLSWHATEWLALRAAHEIRRQGGIAKAYPAPYGSTEGIVGKIDELMASVK